MINVGSIHEGYVLDHIEAGKSMEIYRYLKLDKIEATVAIIKNARSNIMGRKDIIKIETPINELNLDILALIDRNITVNVIKGGQIIDKQQMELPKEIVNVLTCKNPRCITSVETQLDQVFVLSDEEHETYRCKYCEEEYHGFK